MPIYAYRCSACGHAKDVLQKMSDPALSTCPACGAETFSKQVTAAGFQLKGSGWYATDFRNSGSTGSPAAGASTATSPTSTSSTSPSEGGSSSSGDGGTGPAASAGGASCGGSCACH